VTAQSRHARFVRAHHAFKAIVEDRLEGNASTNPCRACVSFVGCNRRPTFVETTTSEVPQPTKAAPRRRPTAPNPYRGAGIEVAHAPVECSPDRCVRLAVAHRMVEMPSALQPIPKGGSCIFRV